MMPRISTSLKKLVLLCLLLAYGASSQAWPLSNQAQISLITVSPGQELYSMYGHSAIRVQDPVMNLDYVFNYGTFNFNTPNFYVKFVRGKLMYQLAPGYFADLKARNIEENRSIYEQVLHLTPAQKQRVIDFLETNYEPQNREYLYDFLKDNCATRIRDVFKKTLGDSLQYPADIPGTPSTYRRMVGIYQAPHPWVDLGVDLAMGLPSDEKTGVWEAMFLPDYLLASFAKAQLQTPTGPTAFAGPVIKHFEASAVPAAQGFFTPMVAFWMLFVVVALVTLLQFRSKKASHTLDVVLFSLTGFLGVFLLFLWLGTDHQSFATNLNLLWAFPVHLVAGLLLLKKNPPRWLKPYFLVTGLVLVVLAIAWKFLPQEYHPSLLPLVLTLALRAFYIWRAQPAHR
ncbi:DUF4105 domain-containing protein [Nibribacter ruber]|uniref:DUF4105 domain-containing protein n=1 Tax=Nibribacter ruber TaxID=2698458 RepID=A0A6P1NW45_9BACT|nr:DUF4105 domain-containing protein [Nibribacter ruber]QHL88056.1 DUF4105 domain-containing protein [Nibribacter ruber]